MSDKKPLNEQILSQATKSDSLKKWVKWALGIHLVILIIGAIGLPSIWRKPVDISKAVSVDLVAPRSEFSQATNKTKYKEPPKPQVKPDEKPKEKPPEAKKPTPKSDDAKKEAVKKPEEPLEKPKEKPKKPVDKKVNLEKKPEKKKPEKKEPEQKEEEFNSVLKNLLATEEEPTGNPIDAIVDEATKESGSAPVTSETLSISDMDALKYQLARCWNIPTGAMDAENLIVDIRVEVNPDRTVRTAEIVDQARYRSDSFFAAAADSARRAVFNPLCTPLALPPEKYDVWKTLLIRFNPRDMFGG